VSGIFRVPVPRKSSRGVDLFDRDPVAGVREVNRRVEQRRTFPALEEPRDEPPPRTVGATATRRSRKPRLMQKSILLVPGSDDQQEMAHRGRRLLQSVAAEVARQTKSRALAVAVRRPEIRQIRASVLAGSLVTVGSSQKS